MSGEQRYPDSKNGNSIQDGMEFQDLVMMRLAEDGVIIQNFSSKRFQLECGENRQRWEIKLDNRCTETGRLSIEIAEKTAMDRDWVVSGIYSGRHKFYIQGNRIRFWLFFTPFLQRLHQSGRFKEHEEPTVKAFFLPEVEADKYGLRFDLDGHELAF